MPSWFPGAVARGEQKTVPSSAEPAFFVHNNKSFHLLCPSFLCSASRFLLLIQFYLIYHSFARSGPRLLARTTPSWQVTATSVPPRLYNYKPVPVHVKTLKPTLTLPCTTPRPSPARGHTTCGLSSVPTERLPDHIAHHIEQAVLATKTITSRDREVHQTSLHNESREQLTHNTRLSDPTWPESNIRFEASFGRNRFTLIA